MAANDDWEFDCPQFVDFCSGVEDGTNKDVWSGMCGEPDLTKQAKSKFKVPYPVLQRKPAEFNSKLSTPIGRSAVAGCSNWVNSTDSVKINAKRMLSKRLSKSDGSLHVEAAFKRPTLFRKKSVSENDLKAKRRKGPNTPMCLKRTLRKTKDKRLKSSEDMELEKIAELQRHTRQLARNNELFLRKLKLKQSMPTVLPKQSQVPVNEKKPAFRGFSKDRNEAIAKRDACKKNARCEVLGEKTAVKPVSQSGKSGHCAGQEPWNLAGPSRGFDGNTRRNKPSGDAVKAPLVKTYEAHSGLLFNPVSDKRMALKPFNLDYRGNNGFVSSLKEYRARLSKIEKPSNTPHKRNKENINDSSQQDSGMRLLKNMQHMKPQVSKVVTNRDSSSRDRFPISKDM